jgi:hypothetical protein
MELPKIMHRIWHGPVDLERHDKFERNRDRFLELNPGWTCVEWNEVTATKEKFVAPSTLRRITSNSWVFSDFMRLAILHRYGGLYLDHDMEPLLPCDPLLPTTFEEIVCGMSWADRDESNNSPMAAFPQNRHIANIMELALERIMSDMTGYEWMKPVFLAGPWLIHQYSLDHHGSIRCVPYPVIYDICSMAHLRQVSGLTVIVHHTKHAWVDGIHMRKQTGRT